MKSRAQKFREIESEFDEPFWDVVKGFAEMGYSRRATAMAIGYNQRSFCELVRSRADISWLSISESLSRNFTPSEDHKRRLQEGNLRRARKFFVLGQWRTVAEIAQIAGIRKCSVRRRIYNGITGDRLADKPMPRSARGRIGALMVNSRRPPRRAA